MVLAQWLLEMPEMLPNSLEAGCALWRRAKEGEKEPSSSPTGLPSGRAPGRLVQLTLPSSLGSFRTPSVPSAVSVPVVRFLHVTATSLRS